MSSSNTSLNGGFFPPLAGACAGFDRPLAGLGILFTGLGGCGADFAGFGVDFGAGAAGLGDMGAGFGTASFVTWTGSLEAGASGFAGPFTGQTEFS